MQGPARVLIVGRDDAHDHTLAEKLSEAGFESLIAEITRSAAELSGSRRPDVVVLNMQSSEARRKPRAYVALAQTLKNTTLASRMRIMCVGAGSELDLHKAAPYFDDLLIGEVNADQVCHRLHALVRLNTMHEELVRRLGTSARYGLDAPPPISAPGTIADAKVLVLGEVMDFARLEAALSGSAELVGALSNATALDYLSRDRFDTVIVNAGIDIGPYIEFARELRRNSRQFNLPLLLLADRDALQGVKTLFEAGFTDIVAKPHTAEELCIRVDTLVRESRFRDALRDIYSRARHYATSDALTGLYNRGFLMEHLESVISDATRTSQSFSLARLSVSDMDRINALVGYAGGDRLLRQIGETIGMLVRGEDLACRYSGREFVVLLPDTGLERAALAMQRIAGVIGHTEFAVEGYHHPISVSLDTGLAGFQQGETAESLVARIRSTGLKAAA